MTSSELLAGKRVAIANRGEIAIRIAVTSRRLGAIPVVLLGEPDLAGLAARQVRQVERVGPAGAELDVEQVVAAARRAGADFVHPGYGFLSERADFAEAVAAAGMVFVGPDPATLRTCGDKVLTRNAAVAAGVPVLPASDPLTESRRDWQAAAENVGYPLLVKPAEAGGGRGLRLVSQPSELIEAVEASRRESRSSGAGDSVYLERELRQPRHVEVQVAGDGSRFLSLGDRDCSVQRRHQKVIEEAPAPNISERTRHALHRYAEDVARKVALRGIATCEFLLGANEQIAFLEVNPRIQVEHPVTELVTGIDLVELQFQIASGLPLQLESAPEPRGHAIEARVYAEDPNRGFIPSPGSLKVVSWPVGPGIRIDAGYASGDVIPNAYDSMIAKVITHAADRTGALAALNVALSDTVIAGIPTNIPWLLDLVASHDVAAGVATTHSAATVQVSDRDRTPALLAAIAHTLDASAQASSDPWSAIGPWRAGGDAALSFHGEDWEDRVTVRREGHEWLVSLGPTSAPLWWRRDEQGVYSLRFEQHSGRFSVVARDDNLEISGAGGRWLIGVGAKVRSIGSGNARAGDGQIRAPLPGKILSVHAAPGDTVRKGQRLVTLTAMKLELVCEAPFDGMIGSVTCSPDQQVEADQVLATVTAGQSVPSNSEGASD